MNIRTLLSMLCLASTVGAWADDEKMKDKMFLSKDNQIERIHSATVGNTRYVVFNFRKRLAAPNSKGRGIAEKSKLRRLRFYLLL
ncbi:MAG: hypothetical protein ABIW76_09825 [Fibrobacteria bacterium]